MNQRREDNKDEATSPRPALNVTRRILAVSIALIAAGLTTSCAASAAPPSKTSAKTYTVADMPKLKIVDQSGVLTLEQEPHFKLSAELSLIGYNAAILTVAVAPDSSKSAVLYGEKWRGAIDPVVAEITAELDRQVAKGNIASGILQAETEIHGATSAGWASRAPQQTSAAEIRRKSDKEQAAFQWIIYPILALLFGGIGALWEARRKDPSRNGGDGPSFDFDGGSDDGGD